MKKLLFLLLLVVGCGSNVPSSQSSPTSTAAVYPHLEQAVWNQPGNTGNDGGGSTIPHGSYALTLTNNALKVDTFPAGAYDNYYFYTKITNYQVPTKRTRVIWEGTVNVPFAGATQAFEWEYELGVDGLAYNGGFQLLFPVGGGPLVRYFDFPNKHWVPLASIPLDVVAFKDQSIPIVAEYIIDPVNSAETHVALTIAGVRYPVNITEPVVVHFPNANYLNFAFQMDTNFAGAPNTIKLSDLKLTMGPE